MKKPRQASQRKPSRQPITDWFSQRHRERGHAQDLAAVTRIVGADGAEDRLSLHFHGLTITARESMALDAAWARRQGIDVPRDVPWADLLAHFEAQPDRELLRVLGFPPVKRTIIGRFKHVQRAGRQRLQLEAPSGWSGL